MELVVASVTVDLQDLAELYRLVGKLHFRCMGLSLSSHTITPTPTSHLEHQDIKQAYSGGVSLYWRKMLDYLADNPDEWIKWTYICNHLGLSPRQSAGMIGAAERRCKASVPYTKKTVGDVRYFRLALDAAEVIKQIK